MAEIIDLLTEEATLPSLGKIYESQIDPNIKLRSMTVAEELKRLSPTKTPYKAMSEIIEACMVTKLPIKVYNLCIGDYLYLLTKLRVATYGNEYKVKFICPNCSTPAKNTEVVTSIDLDKLSIKSYNKDIIKNNSLVILPVTNKEVKLRFQTPRDLDWISNRVEKDQKEFPDAPDMTLIYQLMTMIDTIDGEPLDQLLGKEFIKQLPAKDMNILMQKSNTLNSSIGVDTIVNLACDKCGEEIQSALRLTSEFFRPTL